MKSSPKNTWRPFFFFRIDKHAAAYRVSDPARGVTRSVSAGEMRALELSDGDHTLEQIAADVTGELHMSRAGAARHLASFLTAMAREGLVAWRKLPLNHVAQPVPAPRQMFWDITRICNLKCLHCYNSDEEQPGRELTTAEVLRTLEEIATFGVRELSFSGGEPLLRRDFLEIAAHAGRLGFESVSVATNGTRLDGDAARRLKEANLDVQVSIDGDTAEVHDRIRGVPGSFDAALHAIQALKEVGAQFKVCMTASPLNVTRVPHFVRLMQRLEVADYRVQTVTATGRAKLNEHRLLFPPQRFRRLCKYLFDQKLARGGLDFTFEPPEGDCAIDGSSSGACAAASSECSITWDGRVVPCTYFWSMAGESLQHHSFRWIWENSRLLSFFRDIRMGEIKGYCRRCPWLSQCHGGCKAENYSNGDIFGSNPRCWVAAEHREKNQSRP